MPRAERTATGVDLQQGLLSASVEVAAQSDDREVTDWLSSLQLERYAPALVAAGYDRLTFLAGVPNEEADGLATQLQMKAPHARVFKSALEALRQPRSTPNKNISPNASVGVAEPVTVQAQEAVTSPTDQLQVGQSAWLRIPAGPWINKWVPCDVLRSSEGGGFDVQVHNAYNACCPTWEQKARGNGWKNRQPSDLQRHLKVGMLAAKAGEPFSTSLTLCCPSCASRFKSKLGKSKFISCPKCGYVFCTADLDGNTERVQASESNEMSKTIYAGLCLLAAFAYIMLQIWSSPS